MEPSETKSGGTHASQRSVQVKKNHLDSSKTHVVMHQISIAAPALGGRSMRKVARNTEEKKKAVNASDIVRQ